MSRKQRQRLFLLVSAHCPAYLQIRTDYLHTYHSNTDDIFNTLAVGYALKTKRLRTPEEKYQSGVT